MEETRAANEETQMLEEENEIERMENRIQTMLKTLDPPLTSTCCIYRVPSKIRKLNKPAYSPRVVSIGPIHNGEKALEPMEKLKLRYLKNFLERFDIGLSIYIQKLKEWEDNIRSCYAETIQLSSDDFVSMILIDSFFILDLFIRYYLNDWSEEDGVLLKPCLMIDIDHDLILLENQIPFFVLNDLFDIASSSAQSNPYPFIKLTLHYFHDHNLQHILPSHVRSVEHFSDLIRLLYLPPFGQIHERENDLVKHLPCVSELIQSGLKFKKSSGKCFLDLQFANGVLEMPCFELYDNTESFIRNVMALEQCHYPYHTFVTDYIILLDFLIDTSKDVDVLVKEGIIVNWLGDSNAVATLVNSLCKNITQMEVNSNYCRLCDAVNAHYDDRWHKRKATLRRDYFSTPWKTASSIAAILLLFLTLIQTICSIIALC